MGAGWSHSRTYLLFKRDSMKSLRILTTVHFANPGACLFTESIQQNLSALLLDYDVRVLDYVPRNWYYYELGRVFKIQSKIPFYNIQRHLISERFYRDHTRLDKPVPIYPLGYQNMVRFLEKRGYDALVVGMVIWDLVDQFKIPKFPNAYWLSEKISAVKIAYAASGHRSDPENIQKNLPDIRRILNSYALIGVRDQLTWEIVQQSRIDEHVPVYRAPDPTFLYQVKPTRIRELLRANGIDLDRPILGMLYFGKPELSQAVADYYRSRGFQIIAFSLYNPYADLNLGHILTPHEWADLFSLLSVCITDRFHGTIFSLKANIPFISIEPYAPKREKNSKIRSLLSDVDLVEECYRNPYLPEFSITDFIHHLEEIRLSWHSDFEPVIVDKLLGMKTLSEEFLANVRKILFRS
jgi:hypothetical protein